MKADDIHNPFRAVFYLPIEKAIFEAMIERWPNGLVPEGITWEKFSAEIAPIVYLKLADWEANGPKI